MKTKYSPGVAANLQGSNYNLYVVVQKMDTDKLYYQELSGRTSFAWKDTWQELPGNGNFPAPVLYAGPSVLSHPGGDDPANPAGSLSVYGMVNDVPWASRFTRPTNADGTLSFGFAHQVSGWAPLQSTAPVMWDPDGDGPAGEQPLPPLNQAAVSEPVNQWYPWCQDFNNGQHQQQWMPGENSTEAFSALVQWLDINYPFDPDKPDGWIERNGMC
jgi:hypothetical protein